MQGIRNATSSHRNASIKDATSFATRQLNVVRGN